MNFKEKLFSFERERCPFNFKNESYKKDNIPFIPNKSLSNDIYFKEDSLTIEKSIFFDNSIGLERDELSLINSNNDLNLLGIETFDNLNEIPIIDYNCYNSFFPFKKNRNNFNYLFLESQNNSSNYKFAKIKPINYNSLPKSEHSNSNSKKNTNSTIRCDTLLIKFKSFLGKWFIKTLNTKLKNILKRKIKFFSFNYKKFTIIVSYSKNKNWLDEKIKDLLILGDEPNQVKNKKALKSISKKNYEEINKIKDILNFTYRDIIKQFYLSEDFIIFKNNKRVIELNNYFYKIMEISLLEKNGFITFFEKRKGNIKKNKEDKKKYIIK